MPYWATSGGPRSNCGGPSLLNTVKLGGYVTAQLALLKVIDYLVPLGQRGPIYDFFTFTVKVGALSGSFIAGSEFTAYLNGGYTRGLGGVTNTLSAISLFFDSTGRALFMSFLPWYGCGALYNSYLSGSSGSGMGGGDALLHGGNMFSWAIFDVRPLKG